MNSSLLASTLIGALIGIGAVLLGLFDRPEFVLKHSFMLIPEELVVIVATLATSDYGGNVGKHLFFL